MGYFNIFYKLTRIIDFITRKRNRKFILALCLIVGIVFFSPNVANAQFNNYDSTNIASIKTAVTDIDNAVDVHLSSLYASLLNQEYDIDTIRQNCTTIIGSLGSMQTNLQYIRNDVVTLKNTLTDIDSEIEDLLTYITSIETKIESISQILTNIDNNVEYYGELNHADLIEIQTMLKDYLYGDVSVYPTTINAVNNISASASGFTSENGYNTIYFKIKQGEMYFVDFTVLRSPYQYGIRFGYTNEIPSNGNHYINRMLWDTIDYGSTIEFTAENYKYYYVTYQSSFASNFLVSSSYNEGQEMGVYGGLTNIQQTTINQETQTRETITQEAEATRNTITDTNYNQSDVNVNTSAIDNVSSSEIQGLFTTIFNNFNSAISGGTDSIVVPLPHGRSISFV